MNTPKQMLQRDKDLWSWWVSVTHDDRFDRVLLHANAELMSTVKDPAILEGAKQFVFTMVELAETDATGTELPSLGLHHFPDLKPERQED